VHPTASFAPTAVLIGDVTIEEKRVGLVQRGAARDFGPIVVRRAPTFRTARWST